MQQKNHNIIIWILYDNILPNNRNQVIYIKLSSLDLNNIFIRDYLKASEKIEIIFPDSSLSNKILNFKPKISNEALSLYLQLTYIPAPFTIYEGVKKLEANSYLELDCISNIVTIKPIKNKATCAIVILNNVNEIFLSTLLPTIKESKVTLTANIIFNVMFIKY